MTKKLLIVGALAAAFALTGLTEAARADHPRYSRRSHFGLSIGGYGYRPYYSHYDYGYYGRPSYGVGYYSPRFSLSFGRGYGGYGYSDYGYGGYGGYGYGGGYGGGYGYGCGY